MPEEDALQVPHPALLPVFVLAMFVARLAPLGVIIMVLGWPLMGFGVVFSGVGCAVLLERWGL